MIEDRNLRLVRSKKNFEISSGPKFCEIFLRQHWTSIFWNELDTFPLQPLVEDTYHLHRGNARDLPKKWTNSKFSYLNFLSI